MTFSTGIEKNNSKICMEPQKTPNSQSNLKKEGRSWRHQTSWFQTLLPSYSIQYRVLLTQKRHLDQWNRLESPEINPLLYSQVIFDKGAKKTNGETIVSSINGAGKTGQPPAEEWNWTPVLHHSQKINSKWIKALNVKPKTIKLLQENIGENFLDTVLDKDVFWIWHQKSKQQKQK